LTDSRHLICAYLLDGEGRGSEIDWEATNNWSPESGDLWVHLDGAEEQTRDWLGDTAALDGYVVDGLIADTTRPRCDLYHNGVLLILRGVNLNSGADFEDMVSIRIWIERHRVITTGFRRLLAVNDIREQLALGNGPTSTGRFVARLSAGLTERMGPAIEELTDEVADLEGLLADSDDTTSMDTQDIRQKLANVRRVAIALRRYIAAQREALNRLSQLEGTWLDSPARGRLRDTVDRVTRVIEELDEVRELSAVIQDELRNRMSQRMERTMYVLTVVAAIMLPLGFLTGLLGVNVGGIPGSQTPWAFWAVCVGMVVLVAIEVWLFKRFKWL
jgi:zinc transporter